MIGPGSGIGVPEQLSPSSSKVKQIVLHHSGYHLVAQYDLYVDDTIVTVTHTSLKGPRRVSVEDDILKKEFFPKDKQARMRPKHSGIFGYELSMK